MVPVRAVTTYLLAYCKGCTDTLRTASIHGQRFLEQATGVIFVVDSADVERVGEAKSELDALLAIEEHPKVPFIILGNKTDIPGALSEEELRASLGVIHPTTTGKVRRHHVIACPGIHRRRLFYACW
jgi:GTPase SAR1 family protein